MKKIIAVAIALAMVSSLIVYADVTIDADDLPGAIEFTVAAYTEKILRIENDNGVSIGTADLSNVKKIIVSYGGDATGDGIINGKDLLRIKKQILSGGEVEYIEYADVNRDGVIDQTDLDVLVEMI